MSGHGTAALYRLFFVLRRAFPKIFACLLLLGEAQFLLATPPVSYNGTLSVLASGSVSNPQGVAADLSGNLYIADTGGNRILKATAGGSPALLPISGISPGLNSPHELAVDSSGNLYIADTGNSRIVKVDSSGNGSVIATSSITLSNPQGVAVDSSGNIFISDTSNSRIVEVTSGGTASVLTISGITALSSPKGIAVDILGNLYLADTGNTRAIKVTTALVGSVLSTSGVLSNPVAVGVGMNGVVYVVDQAASPNQRIAVVSPEGDKYDLFFDEVNSDLGTPSAIAISPLGTVYVADSAGNKVNAFQVDTAGFPSAILGLSGTPQTLRFTLSGATHLTADPAVYTSGTQNLDFTIAANSGTPCINQSTGIVCTVNVQFTPTSAGLRRGSLVLSYSDTNLGTGSIAVPLFGYGNAPVAALSPGVASVVNVGSVSVAQPFQAARDGVGNIFVTSYQNSTLLKIPAGGGSGSTVSIPSLPAPSTLNNPTGLAIDGAGNLFIADYANSRIVEVTPAGTSKVIAIRGLSGGLSYPTALNFTANGRLLVDDYGSGRIVMLSPDIYDNGANDGDGTVGFATAYVLPLGSYTLGTSNSTGVAADAMGNVYFTDRNSSPGRILKIDPFGKLSTVLLPNVSLSSPFGVAVDPSQNLYVVDSGHQRVIQQMSNGATSVLQYSGPSLGSSVFGVDVDGSGNVLISDFVNSRLILDNVSKSSLAFPSTNQNASSPTEIATVTNQGDQALVFSANPTYTSNFSLDTTDTNPCTSNTSLSSGASCDVPIIFSPQSVGNLSANINVTNDSWNIAGSTQQIAVNGTAINPGDTTIVTQTNPASTSYSYGQPITISVQVKDSTNPSSVPIGSVTFADSLASTITQRTLDAGGNAILLNNGLLSKIGTHSILASYGGVNGTYLGSSTTFSITISKNSVAVTGPSQVSVTNGQSGSATITVTPNGTLTSGAVVPSGTISYSILNGSTTVVGPTAATLTSGNSNSTATVAIPSTVSLGSYTISVTYSGDGNYEPSSAITIPLSIAQITPTISWSPSSSITYGTNLGALLTASATNGNTTVAGIFTYTATPSGGAASAVTASTVLGAGTYTLTATFTPADTTTYATKTSSVVLVVGKSNSSTALVSSVNPVVAASAVTFTSTVSSSSGTSTGSVSFYDGTTLLSTVALSQGQATYTTSSLATGTHSITAVYSGDSNFLTSTSTAVAESVGKAATTTSLVSSLNPALVTNAITFTTAIITSAGSTPTGTISFYDGSTLLAAVALSNKQAVYSTSSLAVGSHSITAVYSGDGSFTGSTSSAIAEVVQDFTISSPTSNTTDTPSASVPPGGTATFSLQIGPAGGAIFPAPVTLSLSGLPPGATGTLSPSTLPAGSSLSSVTLTIQLPQQTAALHPDVHRDLKIAVTMLALLFLPFAGRMRRTAKGLRRVACLVILFVGAGALVGLSGCGSQTSGFFGQAQKSYTVLITATSGSVSHSTTVNLTVQ